MGSLVKETSELMKDSQFSGSIYLFIAGTGCGLARAALPHSSIAAEMDAVALSVAQGAGFANPTWSGISTGPTAFVPPIYPLVMASLIRIFGTGSYILPLFVLTALAYGIHAGMYPRLAAALSIDRRIGLCAGAVAVPLPFFSWIPHWDAVWTLISTMAVCIFWGTRRHPGFQDHFIAGLASGGIILLNPSSALVLVTTALILGGRRWILWLTFLVAISASLAPWLVRNYFVLGAPVLRTNFGVSLQVSNNSCAEASQLEIVQSGCSPWPSENPMEAAQMRDLGEIRYDRMKLHQAEEWASENRGRFLWLSARRTVEFWFPNPNYYRASALYFGAITILSWVGLFMVRKGRLFRIAAGVMIVYPPLYYIVLSDPRYRYPILWASIMTAGVSAFSMGSRCQKWSATRRTAAVPSATSLLVSRSPLCCAYSVLSDAFRRARREPTGSRFGAEPHPHSPTCLSL